NGYGPGTDESQDAQHRRLKGPPVRVRSFLLTTRKSHHRNHHRIPAAPVGGVLCVASQSGGKVSGLPQRAATELLKDDFSHTFNRVPAPARRRMASQDASYGRQFIHHGLAIGALW